MTQIEKANINPSKNIIDTEGTNEEENMLVRLLGLEWQELALSGTC